MYTSASLLPFLLLSLEKEAGAGKQSSPRNVFPLFSLAATSVLILHAIGRSLASPWSMEPFDTLWKSFDIETFV